MLNVVLPAGTSTFAGSHPASVKVMMMAPGAMGAASACPNADGGGKGKQSGSPEKGEPQSGCARVRHVILPLLVWQSASASGFGGPIGCARDGFRAPRRGEEDQSRNEVSEIDDHFPDRRRVLIAKDAGEQRADQAVLRHERADVEGRALQAVPEAGFMKCAQGASEQTGGDENNEDAGPAEKMAQVQLHAEIVDREAHADGRGKAKRRADRHS